MQKERLTFEIDKEDLKNLKVLAMALGGLTKSEMVRTAIKYHLNQNKDLINEQKKLLKKTEKLKKELKGEN